MRAWYSLKLPLITRPGPTAAMGPTSQRLASFQAPALGWPSRQDWGLNFLRFTLGVRFARPCSVGG